MELDMSLWIHESISKSKKLRNHYKMHDVDIFIKDPLPDHINVNFVFSTISKRVPSHLLSGIDIIYVGQFDVFKEKEVNAVYQDGAIYVTNEQSNEMDMIDDLIHEVAHSAEERFTEKIYSDNTIKTEFLTKRSRLYELLDTYDYEPPPKIKVEYHYDNEIDMYFYRTVGYETLWNLVNGIFLSPYSATSLREYFAVCFEEYFLNDKKEVSKLCPAVFTKLEEIEFLEAN